MCPAIQAFIGFGCSFAGKYFGGYARGSTPKNFAAIAKRSLMSKRPGVLGATFKCADYREHNPRGALIYCDPPYEGMSGYKAAGKFDHTAFWEQVRLWSSENDVYVSSYVAPSDFEAVLEIPTRTRIRGVGGCISRVERIFKLRGPKTQ